MKIGTKADEPPTTSCKGIDWCGVILARNEKSEESGSGSGILTVVIWEVDA